MGDVRPGIRPGRVKGILAHAAASVQEELDRFVMRRELVRARHEHVALASGVVILEIVPQLEAVAPWELLPVNVPMQMREVGTAHATTEAVEDAIVQPNRTIAPRDAHVWESGREDRITCPRRGVPSPTLDCAAHQIQVLWSANETVLYSPAALSLTSIGVASSLDEPLSFGAASSIGKMLA